MNTTYPSDLSDTEWECLQHYLRETRSTCRTRSHSLRSILNAIFYVLRTGCPWRYLPSNFPPWQTVFYHFRRLRLRGRWTVLFTALHDAERQRAGRDPHPSAAIMDAQSVKTVEESAPEISLELPFGGLASFPSNHVPVCCSWSRANYRLMQQWLDQQR